jgi:hypothetical protein
MSSYYGYRVLTTLNRFWKYSFKNIYLEQTYSTFHELQTTVEKSGLRGSKGATWHSIHRVKNEQLYKIMCTILPVYVSVHYVR